MSPTNTPLEPVGGASALPPAADLYRKLIDSVNDYAIYMLDARGLVSSWNPGAQRFKGYTATEIIGRHFSAFYTDEDRARGKPMIALSTAASAGRFEDRAWRLRKDGTRFRAHVVIDPVRDDNGQIIGYAKITRDITETYMQEEALRLSEQRFRLLVSGVTDYAIYMIDLGGHISSWNAGAERFKGYREAEVLGKHFSLFYTAEDRANSKPSRALAQAMSVGRYEDTGWRVRKDGGQFWAHVIIDLIRDETGTAIGFAKITRDMSERRAADLRLLDLERNNEELEQFIHVASHDLREPLRKILSFSSLLQQEERERISAQSISYLTSISSATKRMQILLASLLDLSRVTSQGRAFEPCNLNDVLRDVCSDLQVAVAENQAEIIVGTLPQIEADAAQMRQMFQNLIENAIKYRRPDITPRIEISAEPLKDDARIQISCRDNGIGFEDKFAERIFGVFQRLHPRDRYGGSGIGLSICRKICQRHGGDIRAQGVPDQSAVFTLRLPRKHLTHVA